MTCPFLEYRHEAGEQSFEEPRAFCTAADRFVQPMRADVCNDRYDLHHADHCEIYRAATDERATIDGSEAAGDPADGGDAE